MTSFEGAVFDNQSVIVSLKSSADKKQSLSVLWTYALRGRQADRSDQQQHKGQGRAETHLPTDKHTETNSQCVVLHV